MKSKKLIAPIIITIIAVGYFSLYILGVLHIPDSLGLKFIGVLISLIFIGYTIFALLDRIEEVRSGEEDDLGKY